MSDDTRRALLLLHLQNEVVDPAGYIGRRGIGAVVAERGVIAAAARARAEFDAAGDPVWHVIFARPAAGGAPFSTAPQLREPPEGAFTPGGWGVRPPAALLGPADGDGDGTAAAGPGGGIVVHHTMSAFAGTELLGWLAGAGIGRVVLAGVSTHLVVAGTAFAASDAGLTVEVLADACASPTPGLQDAGLAICAALGRVIR
jgi:biuret amidohydrolase